MAHHTPISILTIGRSTLSVIQAEVDAHPHGKVPRDLRRRQILAVAEDLFVTRGYGATSMAAVAEAAGVTKPVVYDLVGGKEAVFEACMSAAADALAARVAGAVAAVDPGPAADAARLRAGALAWFEFVDERRALWDALLSSGDAPSTEAIEAIRARQDAFVAGQLIASAEAEGRSVDRELAGAVATAMNGAFEAMGRWWREHPDHTAEQLADLYATLLLPGLTGLLGWLPADQT